jgi:hypothetical protein
MWCHKLPQLVGHSLLRAMFISGINAPSCIPKWVNPRWDFYWLVIKAVSAHLHARRICHRNPCLEADPPPCPRHHLNSGYLELYFISSRIWVQSFVTWSHSLQFWGADLRLLQYSFHILNSLVNFEYGWRLLFIYWGDRGWTSWPSKKIKDQVTCEAEANKIES